MGKSHLLGVAVWFTAACGGGGGTTSDASSSGDGSGNVDAATDAAVDAPPPNTTHLGLVQIARIVSNTTATVGFYDVPTAAPGCVWTYAGECSMQACDGSSGLVPASAGDVTIAHDGTVTTLTPTGATYTLASITGSSTGSVMTISAAGATVPAFSLAPLTLPAALTVTAPSNGATLDHTQPLTTSWTATTGKVYVNLSQTGGIGPYPASYARTVRCMVDAQLGTLEVAATLTSQLVVGMPVNVVVAAAAQDSVTAGAYQVTGRVLALDAARQLTVQ